MYNFNDIDALIRNGEDPEAIAKAFTDRLNEAMASNSRDKEKREAGHAFATAWNELVELWLEDNDLPDGMEEDDFYFNGATALEAFESIMNMLKRTAPLFNLLGKIADEENADKSYRYEKSTDNSFDSVMKGFLSEIL